MGQCMNRGRGAREEMEQRMRRCEERVEVNTRDIRTLFSLMECPRHCSYERRMDRVEGEIRTLKVRQPPLPPRRAVVLANVGTDASDYIDMK